MFFCELTTTFELGRKNLLLAQTLVRWKTYKTPVQAQSLNHYIIAPAGTTMPSLAMEALQPIFSKSKFLQPFFLNQNSTFIWSFSFFSVFCACKKNFEFVELHWPQYSRSSAWNFRVFQFSYKLMRTKHRFHIQHRNVILLWATCMLTIAAKEP